MPTWLAATLAAIWKLLEPYVAPLLGAALGAELQKGKAAQDTLEGVMDASESAAASRGWSADDRVRFLERRGRVRGVPK